MTTLTSSIVLPTTFFSRPVLAVAEELIGKTLVRKLGNQTIELPITEVEAYDGPNDKACHGRFGKTKRTRVMFGPAGHWYVYLCYGVHWMLNVVTNEPEYPAAVLIRGAGAYDGPGKLTKALQIDQSLNGTSADKNNMLWLAEAATPIDPTQIKRTSRIGIDYAQEWKDKPYRFVLGTTTHLR